MNNFVLRENPELGPVLAAVGNELHTALVRGARLESAIVICKVGGVEELAKAEITSRYWKPGL